MTDTKELRRLLAEATPGKLTIKIQHVGLLGKESVMIYDEYNRIVAIVGLAEAEANAALFVALHNAAPELLDRLERAEELLRKCGKTVFVGSLIKRTDMADKIEEYFDDLTAPEETPQ